MRNPFMEKAIQLSIENVRAGQGGPFAAVVVKNGKIIAQGSNLVTSTNDPTAHAEIIAIREACRVLNHFQLHQCEIYTTCEPCPMCMGAIYWARPSKVYFANSREDAAGFGFDDDFIHRQLQLPLTHREIPMVPMMREEALQGFWEWKQRKDKIEY